jgi:phosphoglycerate dehydrogenase-like enzyme
VTFHVLVDGKCGIDMPLDCTGLIELQRRFQAGELGVLPIPRTLYEKKVTVVGYGAVGSTLCGYLVTLGANVTAVRRQWPKLALDDDLPIQATNNIAARSTTKNGFTHTSLYHDTRKSQLDQ